MLYGTVPFKANNMHDLHKLIIKAKYSLKDDISEEARSLLKHLLEPDPSKRYSMSNITKHPWLRGMDPTHIRKYIYYTDSIPVFRGRKAED